MKTKGNLLLLIFLAILPSFGASERVSECNSKGCFDTTILRKTTTTYTESAGTGWTAIPELDIPVAANGNYLVTCRFIMNVTTSGDAVQLRVQGPSSPTSVAWQRISGLSGTFPAVLKGQGAFHTAAQDDGATGTCESGITKCINVLDLTLLNGANAGTIQFAIQSEVAASGSVLPGSVCSVRTF